MALWPSPTIISDSAGIRVQRESQEYACREHDDADREDARAAHAVGDLADDRDERRVEQGVDVEDIISLTPEATIAVADNASVQAFYTFQKQDKEKAHVVGLGVKYSF